MSEQDTGVRAAVLTAAETPRIHEFPVPPAGDDDALIAQASTHALPLGEVEAAIHAVAGDVPGADAIGVSVEPGRLA